MLKEFKEFALKGNVVDLAIGVIIGAAFGRIVTSLVNDIIMPPLGLILGNVDFSDLFFSLNGQPFKSVAAAKAAGAPTLNYGLFINNVIDFGIVAFVIFLIVRTINRLTRKAPPAPPAPTRDCPECLSTIPLAAKRCAHCTSALDPVAEAAP